MWCGVVWCGVVWCGVVWCGVWCGVVWCGVVFFRLESHLIDARAEPRTQEYARAYLRAVTSRTASCEPMPGPRPGTGGARKSPTKTGRQALQDSMGATRKEATHKPELARTKASTVYAQRRTTLASAACNDAVQCPSNPTRVSSLATFTRLYTKESPTKIS